MNNKKLYEVITDTGGVHAMTGIALVKGERHLLNPAVAGSELFREVADAGISPADIPPPAPSPSGEGEGEVIFEEAH